MPAVRVTAVEAYSRLAGIYDEIVVDLPSYDRWAAFLHELWHSDAAAVHAVLDVCCGTGLMAQELVARGYASSAWTARRRCCPAPDDSSVQRRF